MAQSTTNPAANTLAFLLGAGAGAAAALLLAPRTGRETREQLKERAVAARERMQAKMTEKKEQAKEKLRQAADTTIEAPSKPGTTSRRRSSAAEITDDTLPADNP